MSPVTISDLDLELYSTSACHLCEQAEVILAGLLVTQSWRIAVVDIADSDALVDRYGERIPVLRHPSSDTELGWPFSAQTVLSWVAQLP